MRAQGSGLLLQVGSLLGRLALPFTGLYAASKFALEGLTEAYGAELAGLGIDAAIVEPRLGARMAHPEGLSQWTATVAKEIAPLSPAQARVLALWSEGMVLTQSCGFRWGVLR